MTYVTDPGSEHALLGSLLTWPDLRPKAWALVKPEHFGSPRTELIAQALHDMPEVNPQLVLTEITRRGWLDQTGGAPFLATLLERATTAAHVELHAKDVRTAARRRQLREAGVRAQQMAENPEVDLTEAALRLLGDVETVTQEDTPTVEPPTPVVDFIAGDDTYDWLVVDLLERRDRVLLTGGEGYGKSTLVQQLAVTIAAGLHPFRGSRIHPQRVLIVDCENGRPHLRRRLRPLVALAERHGQGVGDRLRIISRPEGLDLGLEQDATWLTSRVVAARPDLVTIGPLYRLHGTSVDKEEAARQLVGVLDGLRTRTGCTLLIEAHAPHKGMGVRALRPAGSSLFMRWPEFGLGLRPVSEEDATVMQIEPWRGNRDERDWPTFIRRGGAGAWPLVEHVPYPGERAS